MGVKGQLKGTAWQEELGKDSVGKGSPWLPWTQTAWLLPSGRKGVGEDGRAALTGALMVGGEVRGGKCVQFKGSKENLLSNYGPAGWLPQRRAARRRAGPPSMRWWQENTPSTFTSASMEWVSRSVPLGHSKKSGSFPWRRWELRMCASAPGSTKLSGPKESGMSHTWSVCSCPENVMKMKTLQTSSTLWLPTCPSPPSKIYGQSLWTRTNCWWFNKVIELPKKRKPDLSNPGSPPRAWEPVFQYLHYFHLSFFLPRDFCQFWDLLSKQ